MSSRIEELIPPEVVGIPVTRIASAKKFFDEVARELSDLKNIGRISGSDFLLALLAANLGIAHDPIVRAKPVAVDEEIFQDDIIPFLPNSNMRFYVQVSGVSTTLNLRTKFGETQKVDGKVLDGAPLTVEIPRVFDVPVSRTRKYNLFPTVATQIDIAFAVEFRIGL